MEEERARNLVRKTSVDFLDPNLILGEANFGKKENIDLSILVGELRSSIKQSIVLEFGNNFYATFKKGISRLDISLAALYEGCLNSLFQSLLLKYSSYSSSAELNRAIPANFKQVKSQKYNSLEKPETVSKVIEMFALSKKMIFSHLLANPHITDKILNCIASKFSYIFIKKLKLHLGYWDTNNNDQLVPYEELSNLGPEKTFYERAVDGKIDANRYLENISWQSFIDEIRAIKLIIQEEDLADCLNLRKDISNIFDESSCLSKIFTALAKQLPTLLIDHGLEYFSTKGFMDEQAIFIDEYESLEALPDENFSISLRIVQKEQLLTEQVTYNNKYKQLNSKLLDLATKISNKSKHKYSLTEKLKSSFAKEDASQAYLGKFARGAKDSSSDFIYENKFLRFIWADLYELLAKIPPSRQSMQYQSQALQLKKEWQELEARGNPYLMEEGIHLNIQYSMIKKRRESERRFNSIIKQLKSANISLINNEIQKAILV